MNSTGKYKGVFGKVWAYTVKSGGVLKDKISIDDFDNKIYDLLITGPNGFFRQFKGDNGNPKVNIKVYASQSGLLMRKLNGNLNFVIENTGTEPLNLLIIDNKYKTDRKVIFLKPKAKKTVFFTLAKTGNWYDFSIKEQGNNRFIQRYAGKIETGEVTNTDPFMGALF